MSKTKTKKTIKLHVPFFLDAVQDDEQMRARATELLSTKKISKDLFVVLVCGAMMTESIEYHLIKFEKKLFLDGFNKGFFALDYMNEDGGVLNRGFKFGKDMQETYRKCEKMRIWTM